MTTLRSAPEGLASWPLAPIEELDLYLESAADPSLIQLQTLVRGHLDRAVLESALAGALSADPAARRHLAATSPWCRRLRWEAAAGIPAREAGLLIAASWHSAAQLAALREWLSAWPIPLRDHAARLILAAGPEHDVVILQTHHAAFDGISSLALLTAIAAAYRDHAGNVAGFGPQRTSAARAGTIRDRRPGRCPGDGQDPRPGRDPRRGQDLRGTGPDRRPAPWRGDPDRRPYGRARPARIRLRAAVGAHSPARPRGQRAVPDGQRRTGRCPHRRRGPLERGPWPARRAHPHLGTGQRPGSPEPLGGTGEPDPADPGHRARP